MEKEKFPFKKGERKTPQGLEFYGNLSAVPPSKLLVHVGQYGGTFP